ncbi:MAG: alpha-L-fucosidase [Acidobacteriota bacterium]|nr:alpha-L-fucosidase [Acidobacteriota bacterium]
MKLILFGGASLMAGAVTARAGVDEKDRLLGADLFGPTHEQRISWWREARFGMFIHWGPYSLLAGEWKGKLYDGIGEWIMYKARIPLADYEHLAAHFNPVKFDAEAWVQLAQDAGMKYLIITSKHHDGFAMFGSKVDQFNIVDATPFKRDPMKELAAACARRNIRLGFYYSQAQDWHAPGGAIWKGPHENDPVYAVPQWDPKQNGDFDTYFNTKVIPQIRELLSNYGPIAVIWFDTPLGVMNVERATRLEKLVRELQPNCLISGRLGGKFQSDYDSEGDNSIPNLSRAGAWETPATLNDTWGFKKSDHNWKEPADITFKLVDIVSKGGNYLLNIGPDGEGVIPQPSQDILRAVGRWLKVNGEAIYGAGRSPFGQEFGSFSKIKVDKDGKPQFEPRNEWRCTTKPDRLYVHIFQWPTLGRLDLPAVKFNIAKAYLLADPSQTALGVKPTATGVTIALPSSAPDPIASVVCLETMKTEAMRYSSRLQSERSL